MATTRILDTYNQSYSSGNLASWTHTSTDVAYRIDMSISTTTRRPAA